MKELIMALVLSFTLLLNGCFGPKDSVIKPNLSAEEQQIIFRETLDNHYKTGNFKQAYIRFEKIAKQGNSDAKFFKAIMLTKGRGVEKDWDKGIANMKELALNNNYNAKDFLAKELKQKLKNTMSDSQNNEWLKLNINLANDGSKQHCLNLVEYYKTYNQQKEYFKYLLMLGNYFRHVKTYPKLANIFLTGNEYVKKNLRDAVYWTARTQTLQKSIINTKLSDPSELRIIEFALNQNETENRNDKILNLSSQEAKFAISAMQNEQENIISFLEDFIVRSVSQSRKELISSGDAKGLHSLANKTYVTRLNFNGRKMHLDILEEAAKLGNVNSMIALGKRYEKVPDRFSAQKCIEYLAQALDKGDKETLYNVAEIILPMEMPPKRILNTTITKLEHFIEKGDAKAMLYLARIMQTEPDYNKQNFAIELLVRSSKGGNLEAQCELSLHQLKNNKSIEGYKLNIKTLETLANKGHLPSVKALLKINDKTGDKYSFEQIKGWIKGANNKSIADMHIFLMHHFSDTKNYVMALKWYAISYLDTFTDEQKHQRIKIYAKTVNHLKGSELYAIHLMSIKQMNQEISIDENNESQQMPKTKLGLFSSIANSDLLNDYMNLEIKENDKPILKELEKQSKIDPKICGFILGLIYERSYSIYWNTEKSLELFKLSAKAGSLKAMVKLAKYHLNNPETSDSKEKANDLFMLAANLGNEEAKLFLAYSEEEQGNFDGAIHKYIELAQRDNPWAALALGKMYENGKGIKKNYYQAAALYSIATKQQSALYPYYARAIKEFSKHQTPEVEGLFHIEHLDAK